MKTGILRTAKLFVFLWNNLKKVQFRTTDGFFIAYREILYVNGAGL
jgi:hypothetical protein